VPRDARRGEGREEKARWSTRSARPRTFSSSFPSTSTRRRRGGRGGASPREFRRAASRRRGCAAAGTTDGGSSWRSGVTGSRTLFAKLVYYGPGAGGKTTNLQELHRLTDPEGVSRLLSVATPGGRPTLFFDLLPFELGEISATRSRSTLHRCRGQVRYDSTRRVVLAGRRRVVFRLRTVRPGEEDVEPHLGESSHEHAERTGSAPARAVVLFQFTTGPSDANAGVARSFGSLASCPPPRGCGWLGADAAKGSPRSPGRGAGSRDARRRDAAHAPAPRLRREARGPKQDFDPAAIEEHLGAGLRPAPLSASRRRWSLSRAPGARGGASGPDRALRGSATSSNPWRRASPSAEKLARERARRAASSARPRRSGR